METPEDDDKPTSVDTVPVTLAIGNPILGVFAYLDATLPPELIEEAAKYDVETVREHLSRDTWPWNSVRRVTRETILKSFQLQSWDCPLRKELDSYRIYYRKDMADALTAAYFQQKRGADPIKAFQADYCLRPFGLLTWESIDELKEKARSDNRHATWWQFHHFYIQGDRIIRYNNPTSSGFLLVRGDRLVWEYQEIRKCVIGVSLRWRAEREYFDELGGNRGFLAGDFAWPDPSWVNPVTDEEEREALQKGFKNSKTI